MLRIWRRHRRDHRGAAAVEFGLVLIPLLTLILGAVQYGWYFYLSHSASAAAREAARQIAVGDCWSDPQSFVGSRWSVVTSTTPSPAPSGLDVGDMVAVTTTVPESTVHVISFVPMPSGPINKTFSARMEDLDPSAGGCP